MAGTCEQEVGKQRVSEGALTALGPLDGRYEKSVSELRDYFSEHALIKYRVRVELEWLKFLLNRRMVRLDNDKVFEIQPSDIDYLDRIIGKFSIEQSKRVKEIEAVTNHDVKAVQYYIKEKLELNDRLRIAKEYVHFCCTSEDINNIAYSVMLTEAKDKQLVACYDQLLNRMAGMAETWADIPMLSRTHGQTASPTTVGKEVANFTYRLGQIVREIKKHRFAAKLNGAVGNFNAHIYAYPEYNWSKLSQTFLEGIGLKFNPYTTQIEPHDSMCMFYGTVGLANTILIGMSRDIWQYTSLGYFKQKTKKGEIGSSTMPHKVNPIDFENCEGNLGFANGIIGQFVSKLPISRMQRDLSDSTVLRNQGLAFGYSIMGYRSLLKGFDKLEVNEAALKHDLQNHYEVITEAVQTMLRKYGWENPYELLKEMSRGRAFNKDSLNSLIEKLQKEGLRAQEISKLKELKPNNYLGNASLMAKSIREYL